MDECSLVSLISQRFDAVPVTDGKLDPDDGAVIFYRQQAPCFGMVRSENRIGLEVDYDRMWAHYGHLDARNPAAFHRHRLILELALTIPSRPERVLDVGCGQGELVFRLGGLFPDALLYGADSSRRALLASQKRNPSVKHLLLNLATPLLQPEDRAERGTFDLIVCSEVLEHIEDEQAAVRHLYALTAPTGHVILTVPGGSLSRFDIAIGHYRHYSQANLARLVESAGFRIKTLFSWGFPFHSLYRAAVRGISTIALPAPCDNKSGETKDPGLRFDYLGTAYKMLSPILRQLFFLNSCRCGPQIVAMVQKP